MSNKFILIDRLKTWLSLELDPQGILIGNILISKLIDEYSCTIDTLGNLSINKKQIEEKIYSKFNLILKLNLRKADKLYYGLNYGIYYLIKNCQNQLPAIINRKVMNYSLKLKNENIAGYIITIKGKIRGARKMRKKIEWGTNKYTGSYIKSHLILKTIHIPTKQGVIGVNIKINPNNNIPGRFILNQINEIK